MQTNRKTRQADQHRVVSRRRFRPRPRRPCDRPGIDTGACWHYTSAVGIYVRRDPPRCWLVMSYREGGKVVQRRLKYLGPEPPTAEELARLKDEFKDRMPLPKKRGRPRKGER